MVTPNKNSRQCSEPGAKDSLYRLQGTRIRQVYGNGKERSMASPCFCPGIHGLSATR